MREIDRSSARRSPRVPLALALVVAGCSAPVDAPSPAAPSGARPEGLEIAPPPAVDTVLAFPTAKDSAVELSALVEASDGFLYGEAAYGGASDYGYVFRLSRETGRMTRLHDFAFSDGATPRGGLIQASDGDLYGTTQSGGANDFDDCYVGKYYNVPGCGTAFKLSTAGAFTKLHDFYSAADAYQTSPSTGVVEGSDGNFYGASMVGFPGATTAIFQMTPAGTASILYALAGDESEGYMAWGGLVVGADGALYGTTGSAGATSMGPAAGCGTVFRVDLAAKFQTLHVFTGAPAGTVGDGCFPMGKLLLAMDGDLYGTTQDGGQMTGHCTTQGCGTIYTVTPRGTEAVLHAFTGTDGDGEFPTIAGLAQAPSGTIYGVTQGNPTLIFGVPGCYPGTTTTACGSLFEMNGAGHVRVLFDFSLGGETWGLFPASSLLRASDGDLYGVSAAGGGYQDGTVFRLLLDPATPIVSVSSFAPGAGAVGNPVALTGVGFTGATRVEVNGTAASFTVVSDTEIDAIVPAGATSGPLVVTAPRGTTFSTSSFTVT